MKKTKKIISIFLATVMIISCFAAMPFSAQAAPVDQNITVKGFTDMKEKISNKTIAPWLTVESEKGYRLDNDYPVSINESDYYLIITNVASHETLREEDKTYDPSGTFKLTENLVPEINYEISQNGKSVEQNGEKFKKQTEGALFSYVYLEKGDYNLHLSRDADRPATYVDEYYNHEIADKNTDNGVEKVVLAPKQTTDIYIAKSENNSSSAKVTYLGGDKTLHLNIASADKLTKVYYKCFETEDEVSSFADVKRNGTEANIETQPKVDITLKGRTYPWVALAMENEYNITTWFVFTVINDYTAEIRNVEDVNYTGSSIVFKNAQLYTYYSKPSYTVEYKNNKNIGTASITYTGTGNTFGSLTKTFKIKPISSKDCKVSISKTSYVYDGKTKKPSVTVKYKDKTLKNGTDYTVSYSSGRKNVGKYNVTVKFKGAYSGTVTKTFTIYPKGTSISSIKGKAKGFTVKWKKQSTQTTGCQIQYSTNYNFKNASTVNVKNNKTSKSVSNLKGARVYYVRIRTYKTVNGKKIYSSYSKAKKVATTINRK